MSKIWRMPNKLIRLVRREGPAEASRRVRHAVAWRGRRTYWRVSAKVPAVSSTRRALSRSSRSRSAKKERNTLGSETLGRAHEILQAVAPLAGTAAPVSDVEESPPSRAVGVVVPAYQAAEWLDDCLSSVSRQSYGNWRCYVVDDGSTDATSAIARDWESRDPRFRLIRHGKNGGLSAARNTGLREAVEPIVTFLDADDLLVEDSLVRRVRVLEREWDNEAVAGAWSTTPQVPEESSSAITTTLGRGPAGLLVDFASSGGECPFNAHAPIVRTALLRSMGGFDERMKRGAEDWDMWQRLLRHGYVFQPAGGFAGVYRQRRASMVRADPSGHLNEAGRLLSNADRWAHTTAELVVDPNAAIPHAQLARAERTLRRGATYAGIHVASSGTPDALDDPAFEAFVEPVTAAQARSKEIVRSAVAGVHRGLGLGIASSRLEKADQQIANRLGLAIVERLADRAGAATPDVADDEMVDLRVLQAELDVAFIAETRADVVAFMPVVAAAQARGQRVGAIDLDVVKGDEGAASAWAEHGVDLHPFNHVAFGRVAVGSVVVRRPMGPITAAVLAEFPNVPHIELEAAERELEIECNERSALSLDSVITAGDAFDSIVPVAAARPISSNYGRLLLKEEGTTDPASLELLHELHNKHVGETVVIVGNGPSLNETPIEEMGDVATFAVNGIFYAAERFPNPITYFVVEDTSVFRENTQAIKDFETEYKLFPTDYRPSFSDDEVNDRMAFFRMNGGFYGRDTGTVCHPRFSADATQRLFCGQSVTIINLQLAYWMGFSRVVLIGMDFSYTIPDDVKREGDLITSASDDVNHFHPDYFGKGKSWKDPKLDRVLINYRLAGEMFAADGREVVNSTVGGNLHIFPRMDLLEAIRS